MNALMADYILAATGHRPNKLGGYGLDVYTKLCHLAGSILVKEEPTHVISGMALGWDMAWAESAINMDCPLIAAIPFEGQEKLWPSKSKKLYNAILGRAKLVYVVSEGGFTPEKMQFRNEYMVESCHKLIALWNKSPGGTMNCVRYAIKRHKPVENFWDEWVRLNAEA